MVWWICGYVRCFSAEQTHPGSGAFLIIPSRCWGNWAAPGCCTSAANPVCWGLICLGDALLCHELCQDLRPLLITAVPPSADHSLVHSASSDQPGCDVVFLWFSACLCSYSCLCPAGAPLWSWWPAGIPGSLILRIHSPASSCGSENAEIRCQQNSQVSAAAVPASWGGKQILPKHRWTLGTAVGVLCVWRIFHVFMEGAGHINPAAGRGQCWTWAQNQFHTCVCKV